MYLLVYIVTGIIVVRVIYGFVSAYLRLRREEEFAQNWNPGLIPFNELKKPLKDRIWELNDVRTESERKDFEARMLLKSLESKNFSTSTILDSLLDSDIVDKGKEITLSDETKMKLKDLGFGGENPE